MTELAVFLFILGIWCLLLVAGGLIAAGFELWWRHYR